MANYGEEIDIVLNQVIEYPDFRVEFQDKRSMTSLKYPPFESYHFKISSNEQTLDLVWGGGGVLHPSRFEVNGKKYLLTMHYEKLVVEPYQNDQQLASNLNQTFARAK